MLHCKFLDIADAARATFVFISSVYCLCTNSAEFCKATDMFRQKVFLLGHHVTAEAKMTSEQKRGKNEKKDPLKQTTNQTNKANPAV